MKFLKSSQMLILLLTGILLHSPAQAITVTVDPVILNVALGNHAIVGIMIYGYAPGLPANIAIGSYDFNINYNPAVLGFKSLVFGSSLGNPTNSVTSYSNNSVSGVLTISETSSLSPNELYALQGQYWPIDSFIAATVQFDTLDKGVSPLSIDINSLLTERGGNFDATYSDPGSVTVNSAVPEPSTFLLLGVGVAGLAFMRRRKQ